MKISDKLIIRGLVFLLAAGSISRGATVPSFSPEAIYDLKTLSEIQLSPDAKTVAYLVGQPRRHGTGEDRRLFLLATDGSGQPRPAGASGAAVGVPRWSPDGKQLAFLAGAPEQIHLLTVATGSDEVIASDLEGARDLQWAPSGRRLAFTWKGRGRAAKSSGPQALGENSGRGSQVWVCDLTQPVPFPVTPRDRQVTSFAWAPDSGAVVATSHAASAWLAPRDEVSRFDFGAKRVSVRTDLFGAHDAVIALAWSPDGKTIAWCGREHEVGSGQIMVVAAAGGQPARTVQVDFPGSLEWLGFRPDGRIAFAALMGMRFGFYTLAADGGDLQTEVDPRWASPGTLGHGSLSDVGVSYDATGTCFAASVCGPKEPGNVIFMRRGEKPRRLTDLNPQARDFPWSDPREVSWQSRDGLRIDGLLYGPAGFAPGKKMPLIVDVHGGPRRAWWACCPLAFDNDLWVGALAARGYLVLMANQRGSEGRGAEFVRANEGDLGGGDWQDIETGTRAMIDQGWADPHRLGLGGWSYGGYLTEWGVTQSQLYRAAAAGAGMADWVSYEGQTAVPGEWGKMHWNDVRILGDNPELLARRSPIYSARRIVTPLLVMQGATDGKVPVAEAVMLFTALRTLGKPVEAYIYPGEGHAFRSAKDTVDVLVRAGAWYDRWLTLP